MNISAVESAPSRISNENPWLTVEFPPDFGVTSRIVEEVGFEDLRVMTAFWGGEGKVTAEVDIYNGEVGIDNIGRPSFWGEDTRPPKKRQKEYELGLMGIIGKIKKLAWTPGKGFETAGPVNQIQINNVSEAVATAVLNMGPPPGWICTIEVGRQQCSPEDNEAMIRVLKAVLDGESISVLYEIEIATHASLGEVAVINAAQGSPDISQVA